jgi:hypothetical protein
MNLNSKIAFQDDDEQDGVGCNSIGKVPLGQPRSRYVLVLGISRW